MNKILSKIVWLIILIPGLYLSLVWNKMPDQVALHFTLEGKADRMGNKSELLLLVILMSVMNCIVYLLVTNIYRIDPKKYAADNKDRLQKMGFVVVVFLAAVLCVIIYSGVSGSFQFGTGIILAATGLLFAVIGNYLPNLKPNYFAGLRLPWTLENADNWKKTHAFAGKLWFGGGLFIAIVCAFLPSAAAGIVFFSITALIVLIPVIYSYRLYKSQKSSAK